MVYVTVFNINKEKYGNQKTQQTFFEIKVHSSSQLIIAVQ